MDGLFGARINLNHLCSFDIENTGKSAEYLFRFIVKAQPNTKHQDIEPESDYHFDD
jgi:hypothetical protein